MLDQNDKIRLDVIIERWDTEHAIDPNDLDWLIGFTQNNIDQLELHESSYWEIYEGLKEAEDHAAWLKEANRELKNKMAIYQSAFYAIVNAYDLPIDKDRFIENIKNSVEY